MHPRFFIPSRRRQGNRGYGRVALLAVLLLMLGLVVYWVGLLETHRAKTRELEQQTHLRSAQLADTLAVQTQTLFSGLNFLSQHLVAAYALGDSDAFDLAVRTATATFPKGAILQIAVANREGRIVYSNLNQPPRAPSKASIRDREHFRVHAGAAADAGLFISAPLLGRVSKEWSIQTTRAVRVGGQFAGVVVVSVAPSYLSSFFSKILPDPGDVIMLLRQDGAYLARSHHEQEAMGQQVASVREFLDSPSTHGFYEAQAPLDGVTRYYAWRRVEGLPLLVNIGLDKAAVWEPLHEEIRTSLLFNSLITTALTAAVLLIAWLAWLQRRSAAQAESSTQLMRKLVDQVPGALFQLHAHPDASSRLTYASPGFHRVHQMSGDIDLHSVDALLAAIHPEDAQRFRSGLYRTEMDPVQTNYRVQDANGLMHRMLAVAQPEPAADGGVLWHGYVQDVTQAYAIQEALSQSEERLRLTMAAVQDGVWEWNVATDSVMWDARCWEMLGYPARTAALQRSTMLEWMHPSDRSDFVQRSSAHLDAGESYAYEFRLRTASGGWLWIEARGNGTDFVEGHPQRMLGTHTDISRRVAQAQLLRGVLDESAAAILLATPERVLVQANQRAQSMFGKEGSSLLGLSLCSLLPEEAGSHAWEACYEELRTTGWVRREWRLQLGDGSGCWCEIYGTPLDVQEPDAAVIWTIVDVDERYRAAAALRVAQRRLMAIIEQFPGGVMVQEHLHGPVVAMNQRMCDLLELPAPVEALPVALQQKIAATLPAEMLQEPSLPSLTRSNPVRSVEQVLPDGRAYEIHRVPLWAGDRALGLFWVWNDITARKLREQELEHLAATDTLTLLPNRRAFTARLTQEWKALAQGQASPGVLLMVDIDFFKRVNDTWGHAIGDQVLKHLSGLLRKRLRQSDTPGRWGGEEFVVLLPSTDLQAGVRVAEQLRAVIESTPAPTDQGLIAFTASIGVGALHAGLNHMDEGLRQADVALYYAKRHGRNRVCEWQPEMDVEQGVV